MIEYPVVCIKDNDSMVYGFKVEKHLKTADKKLVENGVFDGIFIIDSAGNSFVVKKVKILGWATILAGFSLKHSGRMVKIDFELQHSKRYELQDLKELLLNRIMQNSYFLKTFSKEEMTNCIQKSSDYKELLSFFSYK